LGFNIHLIAVLLAGLTKPGEVGEILALYRLKSLSLDYKAKLKSPCFFLQVNSFLANNLRFTSDSADRGRSIIRVS
jgi:hypothetical protein